MSDTEKWQATVIICSQAVRMLSVLPLAEMVAAGERADSVGPITDPTLWREKSIPLRQDLELLKAANAFVETVRGHVRRAEERGELRRPAA